MDIKGETINVLPLERDEKGDKLEPEERPAQRLLDVSERVQLTNGQKTEGSIRMQVSIEMSAGEIAAGFSSPCMLCKNFDTKAWREYFRFLSSNVDGIRVLNAFRAAIAGSGNAAVRERHVGQDGDVDVEHALQALGICHPLTETMGEPAIVYPVATCPEFVPGTNNPFPKCFVPKTSDDEKVSAAAFDSIMRAAQGKNR